MAPGSITACGAGEWSVRVPLGRDPATGKVHNHHKVLRGSKRDAQAYLDWYTGLMAAGNASRETVSQSELRDLTALERKAAAFREKMLARIDAGGKAEPGALSLLADDWAASPVAAKQ